jgi:hypothetical protein
MAAGMKMTVFWDVAICNLVKSTDVSDVLYASITRVMTAVRQQASLSVTSINFYKNASQKTVIFD